MRMPAALSYIGDRSAAGCGARFGRFAQLHATSRIGSPIAFAEPSAESRIQAVPERQPGIFFQFDSGIRVWYRVFMGSPFNLGELQWAEESMWVI